MAEKQNLKEQILDELKWDPRVDETAIKVSVEGANVTVSGHTPTYFEKLEVISAVGRVQDIAKVVDEIEVHLPSQLRHPDDKIVKRIASIFEWNTTVPDENVHFTVEDGLVRLSGVVDWKYQRDEIERLVEQTSFIKGISNNIKISEHPISNDIAAKIEKALMRSAISEAKKIAVSISGDTATLSGELAAPYERDIVETAVWSAPGVRHVIDNIKIA